MRAGAGVCLNNRRLSKRHCQFHGNSQDFTGKPRFSLVTNAGPKIAWWLVATAKVRKKACPDSEPSCLTNPRELSRRLGGRTGAFKQKNKSARG